jgi:transcriptional regulator with XRE-family HTH domain
MSSNIANFCKRSGINQKKLANELGISNSAISEIKNKKRNPTYEQVLLLTEMGATLEELFGAEAAKQMLENKNKSEVKGNPPPQASNDELMQQLLERVASLEARANFKRQGEEYRPEVQEGRTGT